MLLWHAGFDSLDSSYLVESRLVPIGAVPSIVADPYRRPAGKALWLGSVAALAGTVETEPLQASGDSDVLIFGTAIRLTAEGADDRAIVSIFSGATEQGRLYRRKNTGGLFFFEYVALDGSGGIRASAGRSPLLAFPFTGYLELRVQFSNSGNVELRLNGSRALYNKNIATEASASLSRQWTKLRFFAAGLNDRWSDFYACNGSFSHGPSFASFLGDTQSTKLIPAGDGDAQQWLPSNSYLRLPGTPGADPAVEGVDLIVLAGQSNANGTDRCPLPVIGLPDPNAFFWIWDKRVFPLRWRELTGGQNNNRQLFGGPPGNFYGPEMIFAGLLQQFVQVRSSTLNPPCAIGMVKGAQDSSALFPTTPDACWNSSVPGNLYNGHALFPVRGSLLNDLNNAIAALGGRSKVGRIHFFWYQGETDAFFDFSTATYKANLTSFLQQVIDDQQAGLPIPVTVHLFQLHQNIIKASAPNLLDGFWFADTVRAIQRDVAQENGYRLIRVDDIPLASDRTHYSQEGQNMLGVRMFESYLEARQNYTRLASDRLRPQGRQSIRAYVEGARSLFKMSGTSTLRGGRVLATTEKVTGSSSSTSSVASIEAASAGPSSVLGSFSLPISQAVVSSVRPAARRAEDLETKQRGFEAL